VVRESNVSVMSVADRRARRIAYALIGACAIALSATAVVGAWPSVRTRLGWDPPAEHAYVVGGTIDVAPEIFNGTDRTVVVFASGFCGACLRSRPALAELVSGFRAASSTPVRMVLITPTMLRVDQDAYAKAIGADADDYLPLDTSSLRIKLVPTVVVVDRTGRILFVREGVVAAADRDAIRAAALPQT
jgi:hypothetical protein